MDASGNNRLVYSDAGQGPVEHHFSPYMSNGGSCVAIGGEGFVVIGSDIRLSAGYSILTRNQSKLVPISDTAILGCTGCWCDVQTLTKLVQAYRKLYLHEHNKDMSVSAIAQMLSKMLYGRRFFPYYVSNVLAGLDEEGNGVVYSYDPVGHCEKELYHAGGTSGPLLQPFLDSQVGLKNMAVKPDAPMTWERAVQIIKDIFKSAAERDIHCGDGIEIKIITRVGIKTIDMKLRFD